MTYRLAFVLLLGAVLTAAASIAPAATPKESDRREKAAAALLDWADWCAKNGAPDAGREALDEARALEPDSDRAAACEAALEAAEDASDEGALARGRRVHAPKIAKAYDALAALKHADADEERFIGYRLRAIGWEPSKARVKKAVAWVKSEDDPDRAGWLLSRARAAAGDAGGALDKLALGLARKGLLLIGSGEHPLVGYLSLPKGWKSGKTYPVLIGVDGAGSNFRGYANASASARGSRDVILLSPVTLSNTNALANKKYPLYDQALLDEWSGKRLAFDGPGVEALLKVIRERFGGAEKVFLTGFSGGGQYTYYKLLQDPDGVAGAAPACANYGGGGRQGAPGAGDSGGPPVLLLTGENDPHREFTHGNKDSPGIEPQTDAAEKALGELGYRHVERRMVKAGHSPLHRLVWEFVDSVLAAK